jgi:hypothetical protein
MRVYGAPGESNTFSVISDSGTEVEILGEQPPDWRVTMVDTRDD